MILMAFVASMHGCAWVTATPATYGDQNIKGIPFYTSMPYLLVSEPIRIPDGDASADEEAAGAVSVIYLPDFCSQFRLRSTAVLSKLDVEMELENSILDGLNTKADSTAVAADVLAPLVEALLGQDGDALVALLANQEGLAATSGLSGEGGSFVSPGVYPLFQANDCGVPRLVGTSDVEEVEEDPVSAIKNEEIDPTTTGHVTGDGLPKSGSGAFPADYGSANLKSGSGALIGHFLYFPHNYAPTLSSPLQTAKDHWRWKNGSEWPASFTFALSESGLMGPVTGMGAWEKVDDAQFSVDGNHEFEWQSAPAKVYSVERPEGTRVGYFVVESGGDHVWYAKTDQLQNRRLKHMTYWFKRLTAAPPASSDRYHKATNTH